MSQVYLTRGPDGFVTNSSLTQSPLAYQVKRIDTQRPVAVPTSFAANAPTLSAAQIKNAILVGPTGAGSNLTITLPTAAQLVAADGYATVGGGYQFAVINQYSAATLTVAAGTGGALVGNAVITASTSALFYVVYTSVTLGVEGVTFYRTAP